MDSAARIDEASFSKRIIFTVVLSLFIFVPATAEANTAELTFPTGTRLALNSGFKAVNTGSIDVKTTSGAIAWECSTASVTGTVVKNNGSEVEATIETATFGGTAVGGKCTSSQGAKTITAGVAQGLPWCLKTSSSMNEDELQIRGGACSEASRQISIVLDESFGECKYKRTAAIVGSYTTEPSDAVVSVPSPEFTKEAGSIACLSALKLEFSLTLERDETGTHPMYFSPPPAPELTFPTGTRLSTESKIRGKNIGELKLTPASGSVSCSKAELTGTLNKNSGSEIEATLEATNISGTGSLEDCTSTSGSVNLTTNVTSGLPWCLRATPTMKEDEFQIRGGKCSEGTRAIKFTTDITGVAECTYERAAAVTGTFATHPSEATFTISGAGFTKTAGPETCPVAPKLDWTFTLEKDEEGTKPAYIS